MEILPMPPLCPHTLSHKDECQLRAYDALEWSSEVIVTALVPELELVVARGEDQDIEVHLAGRVPGVQCHQLFLGQHLCVKLIGVLAPRVVHAEVA